MFYLEIGLNQEHPDVPHLVDWRDVMEMRLKKRDYSPYWMQGAVTVRWDLESGVLPQGFIVEKAQELLRITQMPPAAIHTLHVWAKGIMMVGEDGNGSVYRSVEEGGGKLYVTSSNHSNVRATYVAIYPWQWPHGLEHTVAAFEDLARQFILQALIFKRIGEATDQIETYHNPAAAIEKLRGAARYVSASLPLIHSTCKEMIERPHVT